MTIDELSIDPVNVVVFPLCDVMFVEYLPQPQAVYCAPLLSLTSRPCGEDGDVPFSFIPTPSQAPPQYLQ